MLNQIHTGLQREIQSLVGCGMSLHSPACAMSLLDNDGLDPRRELNVLCRLKPMAGHGVLDEINAAGGMLSHLRTNLIWGHPHQFRTHVFLPQRVDTIRKGLQKRFTSLREKIL